jgi:hypothetical protein
MQYSRLKDETTERPDDESGLYFSTIRPSKKY